MKPIVRIKGLDGNIFAIMGATQSALNSIDKGYLAREMTTRIISEASNYHHALNIIMEYVDFE